MASGKRLDYVSDCDENTSFSESDCNSNSESSHVETSKAEMQKCRLQKSNVCNLKTTTASERRVLTSSNGRKTKCFSRNALLARENRLKKKLYLTNLEGELSAAREKNKMLSRVVDDQLHLITDLRKEMKYLKSVLANSADICNLVRNINQNTGMSVRSSLDNKLSLNNCVSKPRYPEIARKTACPFEEPDVSPKFPSPEWAVPQTPLFDDFESILMNDPPLNAFNFDMDDGDDELFKENLSSSREIPLEHNYTCLSKSSGREDDVGVCLHVSKHRVSLEFCPTCSTRAHQNWDK